MGRTQSDLPPSTMYQQINAPKSNMKKTLLMASVALNALLVVALCFMAFSGNTIGAPVRSVSVNSQVGRRAAMGGAAAGMGLAATRMAKAVNPTSIFETNCGACHQGGGNNIILDTPFPRPLWSNTLTVDGTRRLSSTKSVTVRDLCLLGREFFLRRKLRL